MVFSTWDRKSQSVGDSQEGGGVVGWSFGKGWGWVRWETFPRGTAKV